MTHSELDEDLDIERSWEQPGFGLDPYVLPQFDLLVLEGKISREFADQVIAERQKAGFPMTTEDLQPRPAALAENMAWLLDVGGPAIRVDQDHIELDGRKWTFHRNSRIGSLSAHDWKEGEIRSWVQLNPGYNGGVQWEAYLNLQRGENRVSARLNGTAPTFYEAMAAVNAISWDSEQRSGLAWYPNEHGSHLAIQDGDVIVVRQHTYPSCPPERLWNWTRQHSAMKELGVFFDKTHFEGAAPSREEAEAMAIAAPELLRVAAARYIGDDAFEAGRQAGREEIKAQIIALR